MRRFIQRNKGVSALGRSASVNKCLYNTRLKKACFFQDHLILSQYAKNSVSFYHQLSLFQKRPPLLKNVKTVLLISTFFRGLWVLNKHICTGKFFSTTGTHHLFVLKVYKQRTTTSFIYQGKRRKIRQNRLVF